MLTAETTGADLLAYVCQHPDDDAARLIYADWLSEHGEEARPEFIRVQVELARLGPVGRSAEDMRIGGPVQTLRRRERELLERRKVWSPEHGIPYRTWLALQDVRWRRGFVEEVTLSEADFVGGPCGQCDGTGTYRLVVDGRVGFNEYDCRPCHSTGHTEGHAAALFRDAPVRRVTLAGKMPEDYHNNPSIHGHEGRLYGWWRGQSEQSVRPCHLLPALWDLIALQPGRIDNGRWADFLSRDAALDALSAACLLRGRRQAWPCPTCGRRGITQSWDGMGGWWDTCCPTCHGRGHTVE